MKVFITGGTGFIGGRLAHRLLERGDEVRLLARSTGRAAPLERAGAKTVQGDITDKESMRHGMAGSDVVFHVAGWYKLGSKDWQEAEKINVEGTRNVLELAVELGIARIVYTSTVGVFGDTSGVELRSVDENYRMPAGMPFADEYDRTKWKAHFEVALPMIEQGAPIVIVQPGVVYGPGDASLFGELMRAYYRGLLPIFPAPETGYTLAHIDDIVEGHLLAAEKGRPGEAYILAGPALTMGEIAELWARILGRRPPLAYIPARFLHPLTPLASALETIIPMPGILTADATRVAGLKYFAWPGKAQEELGWGVRDPEEGFRETFEVMRQMDLERASGPRTPQQRTAGMAVGLVIGLIILMIISGRRRK